MPGSIAARDRRPGDIRERVAGFLPKYRVDEKRYLRLHGFFHELFEEPGTEEEVVKSIVVLASAGGGAFADIAGEGEEAGVFDVEVKNGTPGTEVK